MASGREIGDTVSNKDNQRYAAIDGRAIAVFGNGLAFVVPEVALVTPDGFPERSIRHNLSVVGDDVDAGRLTTSSVSELQHIGTARGLTSSSPR